MAVLHTISKSLYDAAWSYESVFFASPGDTILLMGDAVLPLQSTLALASFIGKCRSQTIDVCVLKDDLAIHGIVNQYSDVQEINYAGFVDKVLSNSKQLAW